MRFTPPHYPLGKVKKLAAAGQFIIEQTRGLDYFPDAVTARAFAMRAVAGMTAQDFSQIVRQRSICDLYGPFVDGEQWYVKVEISTNASGEVLIFVSLHPPEKGIVKTRRTSSKEKPK